MDERSFEDTCHKRKKFFVEVTHVLFVGSPTPPLPTYCFKKESASGSRASVGADSDIDIIRTLPRGPSQILHPSLQLSCPEEIPPVMLR